MATITVRRSSGGGMLGLPIEVDGEKIGRVRPNKEITHEVSAGPHEVKVKRVPAWVTAELELAEDEHVHLVCSEASGFDRRGKPSVTTAKRPSRASRCA
jgi:hypothetical protein